jgi:pectate lyase
VGGEIKLSNDIWVKGSFITIDGTTAPSPGITLKDRALLIHGHVGAHDVIVRGIRSRESQGCDSCTSTGAGIGIGNGAYNVVIDRVSVAKAQDQAIQVGRGAHDVTIQWSIFAESKNPYKNTNLPILLNTGTKRISFHHNLVIKGYERMPQARYSESGVQASDTQLDMRNNLIWDWGYAATQVWKGSRANIVGNYFYDPGASDNDKKRAIYLCHAQSRAPGCQTSDPKLYARAYVSGNVSGHGPAISDYLNSLGTDSQAFPAATVSTTDACTAAQQVRAKAGVHPLDSVDSNYIDLVATTSCVTSVSRSLE